MSNTGIVRTALLCLFLQSLGSFSKGYHDVAGEKGTLMRLNERMFSQHRDPQHVTLKTKEGTFSENNVPISLQLHADRCDEIACLRSRRKRRSTLESITEDEDVDSPASADRRRQLYNAFLRRMLRNWPRKGKKRKAPSKKKKAGKNADTSTTNVNATPGITTSPTSKRTSLHVKNNKRSTSSGNSSNRRRPGNSSGKYRLESNGNQSVKRTSTPAAQIPFPKKSFTRNKSVFATLSPEMRRQLLAKRSKEDRLRKLRKWFKQENIPGTSETSIDKEGSQRTTGRDSRPRLSVGDRKDYKKTSHALATEQNHIVTSISVKPKPFDRTTPTLNLNNRIRNEIGENKRRKGSRLLTENVSSPSETSPFITEPQAKDYLSRLDNATQRKKLPRVAPIPSNDYKKKLKGKRRNSRTNRTKKRRRRKKGMKKGMRKRRKKKRGSRKKWSSPKPSLSTHSSTTTSTWVYSTTSTQDVNPSSTESYFSTKKSQTSVTSNPTEPKKVSHENSRISTTHMAWATSPTATNTSDIGTTATSIVNGVIGDISSESNPAKNKRKLSVGQASTTSVAPKTVVSTASSEYMSPKSTPISKLPPERTEINSLSWNTTTLSSLRKASTLSTVSGVQDHELNVDEVKKEVANAYDNASFQNETNGSSLEDSDKNMTDAASSETQTSGGASSKPNSTFRSSQNVNSTDIDALTERMETPSSSSSPTPWTSQTSESSTTTQSETNTGRLTQISTTSSSQHPTDSTTVTSQAGSTTTFSNVSRWIAWANRRRNRAKKKSKSRKSDQRGRTGGMARGSVAVSLRQKEKKIDAKSTTMVQPATQAPTKKSPFVGHKTAYDFLSYQKGVKVNPVNEDMRESNRDMGERMCAIFNKRFVPTRIGGMCV